MPGKTPGGFQSHLKHEVCGAEPSSSEAVELAAGWGGRRRGAGAGRTQKTNGKNLYANLYAWRALVAHRSLLGSLLLHLRLPLGFGLQVPALPFLEATLLVLCLRQ